jgi:hypothetical protein
MRIGKGGPKARVGAGLKEGAGVLRRWIMSLAVCLRQSSGVNVENGIFGEESHHSENVTFGHSVREIAFVASATFRGGSNAPTDLTMLAKCSASFGTNVGHNFGARRSNQCSIEIAVAKE